MERIGKNELQTLRVAIDEALATISEKHGVSIATGRGMYSDENHGTLKLEISTRDESGNAETVGSRDYLRMCEMSQDTPGWKKEWLWQEFTTTDERTFELVGWSMRSRKYPLLARNIETGETHKFTRSIFDTIRRCMA